MRYGKRNARGTCTSGVMSNPGFGDLTVTVGGHRITIPQALIKKGVVMRDVTAKLSDLTIGNIALLNQQYGITVERASDTLMLAK